MTSLNYEKIYTRLFSKIEAYDLIELTDDMINEFLCNWLHTSSANPYVRKIFKTFSLDDEIQELKYEMRYSVDILSDEEFVIEVLALGMVIAWLEPRVKSLNNIQQVYASKEEKYYSQAQHISELKGLVNDTKIEQRRMITDRGYIWNTYLDGE